MAAFVNNPFTHNAAFDFDEFKRAIVEAVYALNEVLDEGLELHPLEEQRNSVRDWRQIGLGIMGLADCLIKIGVVYGSSEANDICDTIAKTLFECAVQASESRSFNRGNYPMFDAQIVNSSPMMESIKYSVTGLNNSQLLTIAPTGSISTMLGVSGGIEPIFANSYTRRTKSLHGEDVDYKVYTPIVQEYMNAHDLKDESELPKEFVTAIDISPKNRIRCQAAWQKWIDASISSTINLPSTATVEDVEDIYMYAWQCGLKGVTIYRAGCAREGILIAEDQDNAIKTTEAKNQEINTLPRGFVLKADDNAVGKKRKLVTGCGSLHCVAFFDPVTGDLLETYFSKGSSGGCNNFMIALSRMISLAARGGVPIEAIVDQLHSCGTCPSYAVRKATKKDTSKGSCCPTAIGFALKGMYDEMQEELFGNLCDEECSCNCQIDNNITTAPTCPQCGEVLIFEGGCNICKACGWSKCD